MSSFSLTSSARQIFAVATARRPRALQSPRPDVPISRGEGVWQEGIFAHILSTGIETADGH